VLHKRCVGRLLLAVAGLAKGIWKEGEEGEEGEMGDGERKGER